MGSRAGDELVGQVNSVTYHLRTVLWPRALRLKVLCGRKGSSSLNSEKPYLMFDWKAPPSSAVWEANSQRRQWRPSLAPSAQFAWRAIWSPHQRPQEPLKFILVWTDCSLPFCWSSAQGILNNRSRRGQRTSEVGLAFHSCFF